MNLRAILKNTNEQRDKKLWEQVTEDFLRFIHKDDNEGSDILRNELLIPSLLKNLGDLNGVTLLDAGCGDGALSQQFELLGASVQSFDFSREMIEAANERKAKYGLKTNFRVGSVLDTGIYDQDEFDVIVANMLLHELDNLDLAVTNLVSYLKQGGEFIFTIFHPAFDMNISQAINYVDLDNGVKDGFATWSYEISSPYQTEVRYERLYVFSEKLIPYYFRPIESYVGALLKNGVKMTIFNELSLDYERVQSHQELGHAYFVPRFLVIGGEKQ